MKRGTGTEINKRNHLKEKEGKVTWPIRLTDQGLPRWTFKKGSPQTSFLSWESEYTWTR